MGVNQPKFYRAISKYGWEAFNHEILEYCISAEHANLRERYYIAKFNSINYGYNTSLGGSIPQHFQKAIYQLDVNKNSPHYYKLSSKRLCSYSQQHGSAATVQRKSVKNILYYFLGFISAFRNYFTFFYGSSL